jgi:hypothetical protein
LRSWWRRSPSAASAALQQLKGGSMGNWGDTPSF